MIITSTLKVLLSCSAIEIIGGDGFQAKDTPFSWQPCVLNVLITIVFKCKVRAVQEWPQLSKTVTVKTFQSDFHILFYL